MTLPSIGFGVRYILDNHRRFYRPGLDVFIRVHKNEKEDIEAGEYGFQTVPSAGEDSGTEDIKIVPPAEVTDVSLHNIGLNQTKLQFGARTFRISHTWVKARMLLRSLTDPYQVFREALVIGIFYNGTLFDMVSITHQEIGGETFEWTVIGNATEPGAK